MVILDIKLENWFLSAGFRQKELGQKCFLFAPAGYAETIDQAIKGQIRSHRWNPLDCVSRSDLLRETDLAKLPQSLSRQVMILYGLILHATFLSG